MFAPHPHIKYAVFTSDHSNTRRDHQMPKAIKTFGASFLILGLLASSALPALAEGPSSYAEAQELATTEGKLLLLDFFTEW